jgi:uncharacterized protein YkwD
MKRRVDAVRGFVLSILISTAFVARAGEVAGSENIDFRELELEVVKELNAVRTNPRFYASHFKEMIRYFYGKELRQPGAMTVLTKEGDTAVAEAIRFLEKGKPIPALRLSRGMSRGARDHVDDQGNSGTVGHLSIEGSRAWERISRHGTWKKAVGENISYGKSRARDVVTSLIIDDGVPGRGHRQNIFNPDFHVVGVAWGAHAVYGTMCIIVFAGEYVEKQSLHSIPIPDPKGDCG